MLNSPYFVLAGFLELRYKTRICKWWLRSGGTSCPHSVRCTFAHGRTELMPFSGQDDEDDGEDSDPGVSKKPPLPGSTFSGETGSEGEH